MVLGSAAASANADTVQSLLQQRAQRTANGVLSLMSYSVIPDLSSSSLSINDKDTNANGKTGLSMTQFGGGFTVSKSTPLYLEGAAAYSRYDPEFVASQGAEARTVPLKWNSLTATGGVGWDFPISEHWVIRPIANFSIGQVASDLKVGNFLLKQKTGVDFSFLDNASLNAYGYGGSLMLDYENYQPEHDIDLELRGTSVRLKSFGSTSEAFQGSASSQTANVYARWRAPLGGLRLLENPVRYVLEASHSHYYGDQAGILGFNYLTSLGLGLELDSSAYPVFITRTRLVARYMFGNNVEGVSVGLAVSF